MKITEVQRHLHQEGCDGWLLYEFQRMNPLARTFLALPDDLLTSRRFFYWIPQEGEPIKIVHAIEPFVLDHLPGRKCIYLKREELEQILAKVLKGMDKVAMEFSHHCHLPYISKVDAGTVDLVRSHGVEVVSSGNFLQNYTCVLDDEQLAMQCEAADLLSEIAEETWEKIAHALKTGQSIDEYQVSTFIYDRMVSAGFTCEDRPVCAVNEHSADPHFSPKKETARAIKKGDFILIDLWCKKNHPKAVYGDITRVAFAGKEIPERHAEIFSIVRRAQKAATDFVVDAFKHKKQIRGCEVDKVARHVIEVAGYGAFFLHRTGHNIYTKCHGPGAHIDNLETQDFRTLIPRTCFSVEPGIYLPGEFGVRLEYDLVSTDAETIQITGGIQEEIVALL
jgi:Xaa-Pro dipeptidase